MAAKARIRLALGIAAVVALVIAARMLPVERRAEWVVARAHCAGA
jgi:hypothetical protein